MVLTTVFAAVVVAAPSVAPAAAPRPHVRVSFDVRDADIRAVFQVLAREGRVNIVVHESVQSKLTMRIRDVPWRDALQSVLQAARLGVARDGNVIFVDHAGAIARRRRARRGRPTSRSGRTGRRTKSPDSR